MTVSIKATQKFGGSWTETKLECLKKYIDGYNTALKNQNFNKIYIDAFAGCGYREDPKFKEDAPLLEDLFQEEVTQYFDGSAKIALKSGAFDEFYFIEKDRSRCGELEKLKSEYPALQNKINIINNDASSALPEILGRINWISSRAVVFLDPFGLSVKWDLIQKISETKAIDLWYLFPAMIGRMIHKDGTTKKEWEPTLDGLFGCTEWRNAFTRVSQQENLFDTAPEIHKDLNADKLAEFVKNRLRTTFPKSGVCDNHLLFTNSKNSPLFVFCFAAANVRGAPTAKKIADHILNKGKSKRGK